MKPLDNLTVRITLKDHTIFIDLAGRCMVRQIKMKCKKFRLRPGSTLTVSLKHKVNIV